MRGQGTTVGRRQLVEPLAPPAPQGLVVADSLREEQPLDPVDVLDALGDQRLAFAADPPSVLLLGCRRPDHRANPGLAALVGQQRADQGLTIDLVGLCPSPPAGGGDRGRINNMTFDAFTLQDPVQPKPVQSGLLDRDNGEHPPGAEVRLGLELGEFGQQPAYVAAAHQVLRHLLAMARQQGGDKPGRSREFQRHEDGTAMGADSGLLGLVIN
jgi:hypothetical protein